VVRKEETAQQVSVDVKLGMGIGEQGGGSSRIASNRGIEQMNKCFE
jgi:hypothetical protein